MDIVKRENVNVANALIVEGLTLTEVDNELEKYLERYGSISRTIIIDNQGSEFHRNAIIEYNHSSAIKNLCPFLPLTLGSLSDPGVTFRVRALATVYTQPSICTATEGYLEELKAIAEESGLSFQSVLQEELEKLRETHSEKQAPAESQQTSCHGSSSDSRSAEATTPSSISSPLTNSKVTPTQSSETKNPTKNKPTSVSPPSPETTTDNITVTSCPAFTNIVDPPSVQRMVVEHIVKTSEATLSQQTSVRLRVFSGRSPRPPNEPDFDTWRASVDFLINDPSISDLHRTRKILDSLLPPAADIVKLVRPPALPAVYLELLESVYGSVEDGDELLAKLMSTLQNQSEKPSDYLHRLQVILSAAIRRGGIAESERDRYLLKQFCRGCWDNGLIADLQLGKREIRPPTFAELAVLIRTQEDKHASKEERMRKHLGMTKPHNAYPKSRSASNQVSVCSCDAPSSDSFELKKQVAEIQAQVTALKQSPDQKCQKSHSEKAELTALKKMVEELCTQVAAVKASVTQGMKQNNAEELEISRLQRQIAELQTQNVTRRIPQTSYMQRPFRTDTDRSPRTGQLRVNRPRPWYCFRCGEDGHLAVDCENAANPSKVEENRLKLREQQSQWDSLHGRPAQPLN
ncbi:zinc finger CCHC domain-containing protein 12-like [Carassius auratus]|uniref:Zinc finger CCHC domain-containing protein 12-like n=1 Tax=Carassius auratus TaxID=7957 RepID=A0A6P6LPQ1_CARAU|nr:zinc finger CCHC domain-containing protein 12-like [Carassius auratus]